METSVKSATDAALHHPSTMTAVAWDHQYLYTVATKAGSIWASLITGLEYGME